MCVLRLKLTHSTSKVGKYWHQLVTYIQKPHVKGLRI